MDHHGTEANSRRNLLNGLVTAATRSWRYGLQPNGHTSSAMVFPTVTTPVNTSPTNRTPITESTTMTDEQRRRLQQQRQQDHRLNTLWYGGDDLHQQQHQTPTLMFESNNRYPSTDDWEKQPLRQRPRKFHKTKCRKNFKQKRSVLPRVPVIWAAILHIMYAIAMATVYYKFDATTGSGWLWFRGIVSNNLLWLWMTPPVCYYIVQAFCAAVLSCFFYQWCCQQPPQGKRLWCYYVLLLLFSTALFPSVPINEVFGDKKRLTAGVSLQNSTVNQNQLELRNLESLNRDRLALYEGLWQVIFFTLVAYCLVLPMHLSEKKLDKDNNKSISDRQNKSTKHIKPNDEESRKVTTAVLLFTIMASVGHTSFNVYVAYFWYIQQHNFRANNSTRPMAAIQQLIANIVILTCINLIGWLLRRSVTRDRADIKSNERDGELNQKHNQLRFALRIQANKLNLLLKSLLPKRVFMEMKHDIVADAACSYNTIWSSSNKNYQSKIHLQHSQHELQLLAPQVPKMYLKEYENVSIICASITGLCDMTAPASHSDSGFLQSGQFISLVDRLMSDLFRKMARRNHCLPIQILGHRIVFVSGLPSEESYEYDDSELRNAKMSKDDSGHARNAIQMGLDLINTINAIAHDVSRRRFVHKTCLNARVGIHSGRITCGVLGFTRGIEVCSDSGSRWQYEMWGRDYLLASEIESSGRHGWVHVSQATIDQITKKRVTTPVISRAHLAHPGVVFRNNKDPISSNNKDDYTFERSQNYKRFNTYFVVPKTICSNLETSANVLKNNDNKDSNDNIGLLILHSLEHQLHIEDTKRQYVIVESVPDTELMSEQQLPTSTTAVVGEVPIVATSLASVAPASTMKMIMNRHRRSRYEQDPSQGLMTKNNSNSAVTVAKERSCRWENIVFENYDNDNHNRLKFKSDNDDLFRLAKSQLLLLCVIITLFVVNVTTMPWTLLLGITFITPFVVTAGELIYVMALLIGWLSQPSLKSTSYIAATIADDNEFYLHYDSDNYDSDSSSDSDVGSRCFDNFLNCHYFSSMLSWMFSPFQSATNSVVTTRNPLDNNAVKWWHFAKWCRCCCCYSQHNSWFTKCLDNNRVSSYVSSDDSDIESRLGFRNEHAMMAAAVGPSAPQQLQFPQPNNINTSYNSGHLRRKHLRLKRKYQDEERHTWFFWLAACSEVFVVLLICLLALLNAFTCEPVEITTTNPVYDQFLSNSSINTYNVKLHTVNITQQQHSPLTCPWPQYAMLTCCLACVAIAVAFPIYYGSLPTLRMKIGTLFVITFVFGVAFVHFTHQHVFHAASISSITPSCCNKGEQILNHALINNTVLSNFHQQQQTIVRRDIPQKDQLFKLQEQEQLRAAGLDTATTTVYVVVFSAVLLVYFIYAHQLKDQRAHHRVKTDSIIRRLSVLRAAHRRTIHAFIPNYVAQSLKVRSCNSSMNLSNGLSNGTLQQQNHPLIDTRSIPMSFVDHHIGEQIFSHISKPLYHCGCPAVVVIFATIVQQEQLLSSATIDGEIRIHCHRQLLFINKMLIEFDKLLDSEKYCGLVEKIKTVGTNTYMVAVGLQHQHRPERELVMLLKEIKKRNQESYSHNEPVKKNGISNQNVDNNDSLDGCTPYDFISASYVNFALDFICDMRRALHRQQIKVLTPVENMHIVQPSRFTLRVGVNIGPVVAGLIGCNDGIWKQPKFDLWGNTVNVARKMDTTGIPGSTQVTNSVVDVIKSLKSSKYKFDVRPKVSNKDNKKNTYFVREHFDQNEDHHSVQQQQLLSYHQLQLQQSAVVHKNHFLEPDPQVYKHSAAARLTHNAHCAMAQPADSEKSPPRPIVTVYPQHSYYNAMVQQELRQKCLEPLKTPPPPPQRSPPPANIQINTPYSILQHQQSGEHNRYLDQRQQLRGIQKQRTPDTTIKPEVTYARPLQQQKHQKKNVSSQQQTSQTGSDLISRSVGPVIGNDTHQSSPTTTNAKLIYTKVNVEQSPRVCRPNVLPLVNITAGTTVKNFDADRPLPAPPRSSDTVAGRQRHHHDPRRKRRQHHGPTTSTTKSQENNHDVLVEGHNLLQATPAAWPSTFRSPISAGSFVSVSSRPSSLSSSGSTDAGETTTSNNNFNTTSGSSSDESFGLSTAEEGGGGVDQVVNEDFDTAASSAAVSPIHHRYRHQQHMLLRQWSPSTTVNSSPVRRSSSFRSPVSGGDITAPSSSSLRSPHSGTSGAGCTQSLNRRRPRLANNVSSGGGGSSSRRRRRRQQLQQQNDPPAIEVEGHSTTALNVVGVNTVTANVETYGSPPSSPWKKHQQPRRQIASKDQGVVSSVTSPDFTDEIRRILLLDHHRDNVRLQQDGLCEEQEVALNPNQHHDDSKQKNIENVTKQTPELQHKQLVTTSSSNKQSDKNDKNYRIIESNDNELDDNTLVNITTDVQDPDPSATSFEERERLIIERVKRQEAEVRRIIRAHKNNMVGVKKATALTTETGLHNRRRATTTATADSSEWSDDESVEPSSLLDDGHQEQSTGFTSGYKASNDSTMTAADYTSGGEGDSYTTGGDRDGYTTTGYTTDETAAAAGIETQTNFVSGANILGSPAHHFEDNLSTINDTGLTDAEAALSDVNSMIDFNDGNDSNRYGSRRQSSLSSSSVCPYASDSLCDDDDDYNNEGEFIFQDEYDLDDEKLDSCDDDNFSNRHFNMNCLLQQQQLFLSQSTASSPISTNADNNTKRLYPQQYTQQLPHNNVNNTTSDISQKSLPCVPAVGTTTMTTLASSTSMANSFSGNESMTNTCTVNTTSSTNHELEKLLSPSTSTKND